METKSRKGLKYIIKKLDYENKDLRARLATIFLATGFLLSIVGIFATLFLEQSIWFLVPHILVSILCLSIPLFSEKLEKHVIFVLYFIGIVYFPFLYYTGAGNIGILF